MTITHPRLLAGAAVLSLAALTGCSGGANGSATGSNGDRAAAPAAGATAEQFSGGNTGNLGDTGSAVDASTHVETKSVIKTGDVAIRTSHPQQARDRVDHLLRRLQGSIDDEQTVYDKHGDIRDSHLVLRVPVASFATAIDDVERLGTVVHSTSAGKDVTTRVIDIRQRLKTLRISLHELNSFQRRAANIDQLLRFENAITQRRGQYQSLKAQRDYLANQTSMSTISLDISAPPVQVTSPGPLHHAGFLTGLRHGWAAFTGTIVVALTALGAVLPFAVLLALVGLPLWWWGRRALRNRPVAAPAEAPPAD
jgi:hypothetical protein